MKNSANLTIILLAVSAAILTAMLIGTFVQTQQQAAAVSVSNGSFIMVTGRWTEQTDMLWMLSLAANQLNVYFANVDTNTVDLLDSIDVRQLFASGL